MSPAELACIDGPDGCAGPVQSCWPGYGERLWPRCEHHDGERRRRELEADPVGPFAPPGFDPDDTGECWDYDY